MLMVCMTGTAVKIEQPAMMGADFVRGYEALINEIEALGELTAIANRFGVVTA